ncbi:hypothetical protein HDR58_05800 [bacterium]|nr:hypothetical protein [bacterium]
MKVESNIRPVNIKQIQQQNNNNNNKITIKAQPKQNTQTTPSFTGGFDLFLRFLDTNQAWGANAVDLFCMVLPRTLTDFSRGPEAGTETLRREGMGTANHSMVGGYGTLAGLALATGINSLYGLKDKNDIKASSIFADAETMDLYGKIYDNRLKAAVNNPNANPLKESLNDLLSKYEALQPDGSWKKLDKEHIDAVTPILENEIKASTNKISKAGELQLKTKLVSALGAENNLRIIADEGQKPHSSRYTVDYIIENAYKLGKIFTKDKVQEAFINSSDIAQNAFLKAMKSMNVKRSLAGIGVASAFGISAQPLNMYLTKKKTGKSGFVGGGEEDKSVKFKALKTFVATLFGAGVLATIGNPKNLVKDLQFKGFTPTIKQFKFIYGITIMSRLLSSRNDNELRESTIKDSLGFASWLILGNFIQKLVALGLDKSLIKNGGQGAMNWIKNSVLMSRDEVLHSSLKEKVFDKAGKALSYKEMVKLADKATKKKLNVLAIAQLAGYAYSALALGAGIPKLNIYITNKLEAKKASKKAPEQADTQLANAKTDMLQDTNREFLSQKQFTGNKILAR